TLAPGADATRGFFGWLEGDHPAVSSEADVGTGEGGRARAEAAPPSEASPPAAGVAPAATLFSHAPLLACDDLDAGALKRLFGAKRRHEEFAAGSLLSFFTDDHRQLLRTGAQLVADEAVLASTIWMDGVFHSLVTQGHANINRVLSTTRTYL